MATPSLSAPVPREIRRKLAAVRWRIRAYVLFQGLCLAAIWLAGMFWIGLAIDYLPVLVGASEMPQAARAVLLSATAIILAFILYRWVLRRTLARLGDHSMAVLLERHFDSLGETLITTVELARDLTEATPVNRQLLATTQLQALKRVKGLPIRRMFNFRPLLLSAGGAGLLGLSIVLLYVVNADALELGFRRLYLLRDETWPRHAHIEVVGIEASQLAALDDLSQPAAVVPFTGQRVKVARGSDVELLVRADGSYPRIPDVCTISYRTDEGVRGRVNMTRIGQLRNGYQHFRYDGKPLRGILSDVEFDVVGYDHRVRNFRVEVVDSPAIVRAEVDATFPEYMVDEATSSWLPRTVPLTTGVQLPMGTEVRLRAESNKPLSRVVVVDTSTDEEHVVDITDGEQGFELYRDRLTENLTLEVRLVDTDHVTSDRPYRVLIEAVPDLPPVVNLRLQGIGSAVTPDVLLPLAGALQDDYGIERAWVELARNEAETKDIALATTAGDFELEVDFREMRRGNPAAALEPGNTLNLVVKAQDHCDLTDETNVGVSDHFQFDVVTPEQLLAMLEARELGLRQRFEQVITELRETRDALARVRNEGPESASELLEVEPEESEIAPEERLRQAAQRVWSLRLLRSQRAVLQSQKSAQETLGVAASFRDIRQELIHNRVDSEDRKERLQNAVIDPIERIGGELFPELEQRLAKLVAGMDDTAETSAYLQEDNPEIKAAATECLAQVDLILARMEEVLKNMLDLETYNELLDIVRSLIEDQEQLRARTKDAQKKQVLDLFQ